MKPLFSDIVSLISAYGSRISRLQYLSIFFMIFGSIILWTTLKYTVLEYSYYRDLADKQQTITVKNPVSRGSIFSSNTPTGVFATSTDLPDLAIDPQAIGSRDKLIPLVSDVVFFEFCGRERVLTPECEESILSYLRKTRPENEVYTLESIRNLLTDELRKRITKPFLDFVLVKENLTPDEIQDMEAFAYSGITLVSGNLYVDPTRISDPVFVASKFESLLGLSPKDALFRVSKRPVQYVKILRRMSLGTKDYIDARLLDEKEALQK